MRLQWVYKKSRGVAAIMDDGACPLIDGLRAVSADMQASAKGLDVLFRRYAEQGRQGLTSALFHEVDKNEGIWEFIKGRLRVLCFEDPADGSVIILSHYFVKQTQKTPKSEVQSAVRARDSYIAAKKSGQVEFVDTERKQ